MLGEGVVGERTSEAVLGLGREIKWAKWRECEILSTTKCESLVV